MYQVKLKSSAEKSLESLPAVVQHRIVLALRSLETNPRPHGSIKMAGSDNLWRIRVGDYRVVYEIQDDVLIVLVIRIGHRRDIYRK